MSEGPADRWYARTVWGVSDIERSAAFYVEKLGFKENSRYAEENNPLIVQVSRAECELILSTQWPERVGHGLLYLELAPEALAAVRAEFEGRGVALKDGWWGGRLMAVEDPDCNALWFPYPVDEPSPEA